MRRRFAAAAFALVAFAAAGVVRAQQPAPRDIWPQAAASAREGDFDAATKRTSELATAGRTYGIKTYPLYAAAAAGLSSEAAAETPELAAWASKTALGMWNARPWRTSVFCR